MLFSARYKFGIHMIQLVDQLFTHRLTQVVTLSSREVCNFTREKHHLLLVDCNAVRILEVFLHTRQVIRNRFYPVFALDKLRDVFHWARTIKRIHRNQILKSRRMKLTQILLHTWRFKLERTDCSTITIKIISGRVFNRYHINIDFDA